MAAKYRATRQNRPAREILGEAMKEMWAAERELVANCRAMEARVLAAVAEIRALSKAPVAPAYYGSRRPFTRPAFTRAAA